MVSWPVSHAVRLAVLGVVLELTVSANLLTVIGIPYVVDGGSILFKLHPGTDLILLSFVLFVAEQRSNSIVGQRSLIAFLGFLTACWIYALALTGTGNLVVLTDTFLPAGLLAAVLSRAHPDQLRHLRCLMQCLSVANALLALGETAAHATLIPLYLNDLPYQPHSQDFRPTALLDHPLTGSVVILLGLALAPGKGWCRLTYPTLMWAALFAFGGRVAAVAALLMVGGCHFARSLQMILYRHPQAPGRLLGAVAAVSCAALAVLLAAWAGFGTRLSGHLYWDDSAQVRLAQWQLLDFLDSWQWLFGTRREDLLALLVPLRLGPGVEVIENFWLLMFVSFGLLGFPLFLGALVALFVWCWKASGLRGRLLVVGVLLVASTSNSIGRKSTILVCMVAAVACMPARPSMAVSHLARRPLRTVPVAA